MDRLIEMLKTVTCKNVDGVNQVFGAAGKEFTVDHETATTLVEQGAAKFIDEIDTASAETE